MISNPWVLCGIGVIFCLSGVYFFFRNIFEEDRSIGWPIIVMLMGITLIAMGSYQYIYHPSMN
ncbi:MAG: hypothetical protein ABW007_20820 [Chitinophagaceae bacterium]